MKLPPMLLMTMMLIIVKTCGFCCCCSRCYGRCNSVRRRSSHCSHCSLRLSRRAIVSNHVLDNELMMFIYIYFIFAFILYLPTYIYWHCALASTPPGMPGTHPLQYFGWGDVNTVDQIFKLISFFRSILYYFFRFSSGQ